jgi:hypothetical protein
LVLEDYWIIHDVTSTEKVKGLGFHLFHGFHPCQMQ